MVDNEENQQQRPPQGDEDKSVQTGGFGGLFGKMGDGPAFAGQQTELIPFLPADVIGGSVPYIAGTEDEAVWNAAAQACGTERVYYVYTVSDNRCWYLAVPAASMANSPDSWCPIAAALPGNSEHWDRETVYLYEHEGSAVALRWDPETGRMQVFSGAARTILPRIQSLDANFVTVNPKTAKPVAWKNRALRQEMLSRMLTRWLFFSGLAVTVCALLVWLVAYAAANVVRPNLEEAEKNTKQAALQLLVEANDMLKSGSSQHLARIQELQNELLPNQGLLLKYELKEGDQVEWEALIPQSLSGDFLRRLKATAVGIEKEDGRIRIRGTR